LHNSIEPLDLRIEYFELRGWIRVFRRELRTKDLEMNNHCVERVLYLVRDARCDSPEIGQFFREIPLRFQLLERLVIAHADQRAHRFSGVLDVLDRREQLSWTRRAGKVQRHSRDGLPLVECALDGHHQRMIRAKRFVDRQPAEIDIRKPKRLFRIRACKNNAPLPVDKKQSLLEMAYHLAQSASHDFQLAALTR